MAGFRRNRNHRLEWIEFAGWFVSEYVIIVLGWYGNTERRLEICSGSAVWYHAGQPVLPICWVLLRDPDGYFEPEALLCTDPERDPRNIIR